MARLFISYRRDDTDYITGRIYERLAQRFGESNVFMDVDAVPLGADFREAIERSVTNCDAILIVIGQSWIDATSATGTRRLDDDGDFVRIEIETALKQQIPMIPILVSTATMPKADELPVPIKELAYRNATKIRPDPDFDHDIANLTQSLDSYGRERPKSSHVVRRPEFTIETVDDVAVIELKRNAQGSRDTQELLDIIRREHWHKVVISLRNLPHLNSDTLMLLSRIYVQLHDMGTRLRLCDVSTRVHALLLIQRLDGFFDIHEDRDEALRDW